MRVIHGPLEPDRQPCRPFNSCLGPEEPPNRKPAQPARGRQVPQHLSHCPSFSSKGSTNSYKNLNSQISQRTDQHHGVINSSLWPLPPPFLLFFFFPNMIFALLLGLEGHYDLGIENVSRATNQRVFGIRGMGLFRPSFTASSVLHCLREMRTCDFFRYNLRLWLAM